MESDLKQNPVHNIGRVRHDSYASAKAFSDRFCNKYKKTIVSVLIKGFSLSGEPEEVVFVVDDLNNIIFDQQVSEMRVAASETAFESRLSFRCDFVLASVIWESFKSRDKSVLELFRSSVVVQDSGFFLPIQDLLVRGKIRPSKESVNVYFVKAEQSMKDANASVAKAMLDLYWAVTDSAHAAVMVAGVTPPSPKDLSEAVRKELVVRNLVHKRCAEIVESFYDAAKRIMHREVFEVSGREFDSYLADADFFIREMGDFVRDCAEKEKV